VLQRACNQCDNYDNWRRIDRTTARIRQWGDAFTPKRQATQHGYSAEFNES